MEGGSRWAETTLEICTRHRQGQPLGHGGEGGGREGGGGEGGREGGGGERREGGQERGDSS